MDEKLLPRTGIAILVLRNLVKTSEQLNNQGASEAELVKSNANQNRQEPCGIFMGIKKFTD